MPGLQDALFNLLFRGLPTRTEYFMARAAIWQPILLFHHISKCSHAHGHNIII